MIDALDKAADDAIAGRIDPQPPTVA